MKARGPLYQPLRRIAGLFALSTSLLVTGTLGFHWIEGQPLFDSFYFTLITLTTVGYGEIFELSNAGRHFNAILILAGFGVVFITLGMMAESYLELEALGYFGQRRIRRMIDKMSGHLIVCGIGRVGRGVIDRLKHSEVAFMAVDSSPSLKDWARETGVPLLTGDATLDGTLEQAGARRAKGLVAATSSDAVNVYITLSARVINPDLRIAARASDEEAKTKLLRAGANTVITPYAFTGDRIAQAMLRPESSSILDLAAAVEHLEWDLDIGEYCVTDRSRCCGKTLQESGLTDALNVIVLAVTRSGETLQFNPPSDTRIESGHVLVVLGRLQELDRMKQLVGG